MPPEPQWVGPEIRYPESPTSGGRFDHACVFGYPIVKQLRNPHNYFKDHQAERHGLELTEHFCSWLRAMDLKGTCYLDCMVEIMAGIEEAAKKSDIVQKNQEFQGFIEGFGELDAPPHGHAASQPHTCRLLSPLLAASRMALLYALLLVWDSLP